MIITKDKHFRRNPKELLAYRRSKARVFVVASGDAPGFAIAEAVLTALRKMEKIIETVPPPFMVRVLISGTVEMIRPDDLDLPFLTE